MGNVKSIGCCSDKRDESRADAKERHDREDVYEALYGVRYELDDDHIIASPVGRRVLQDLARQERKRAESPTRALHHKRSESPRRLLRGRYIGGSRVDPLQS